MNPGRSSTTGGTAAAPRRARRHLPVRLLGRATANFVEDRGTHLSAAISYYALFALFPLTLLAASIFGIVLRSGSMRERVIERLFTQLPLNPNEADTVREALANAAQLGPTLSVLSLAGALWTGGALAAAIRSALNVIFNVPRGRPLLRGKLFDYVLLPIVALPFVGGLALTTVWRFARRGFEDVPVVNVQALWLWEIGAFLIPLVLSFTAFTLLYWLIPNRRPRVRHVWPGALVAALLFEGLKLGFAFYLANVASFDLIYGPLSSVIVLMFWVYLTANIMLFGAEIASEVPHVLLDQGRHGQGTGDDEGDWRRSLWSFVRGLVLAGDDDADDVREARDQPEERDERDERDEPDKPDEPDEPDDGDEPDERDRRGGQPQSERTARRRWRGTAAQR